MLKKKLLLKLLAFSYEIGWFWGPKKLSDLI